MKKIDTDSGRVFGDVSITGIDFSAAIGAMDKVSAKPSPFATVTCPLKSNCSAILTDVSYLFCPQSLVVLMYYC